MQRPNPWTSRPHVRVVQDLRVEDVEQAGRRVRVAVVGDDGRAAITFSFEHEQAAVAHADQAWTWMVSARRLTYVSGPVDGALIDDAAAFWRAFDASPDDGV